MTCLIPLYFTSFSVIGARVPLVFYVQSWVVFFTCLCMYVCMYVCTYVRICACMVIKDVCVAAQIVNS
jgi:hypothetical protein